MVKTGENDKIPLDRMFAYPQPRSESVEPLSALRNPFALRCSNWMKYSEFQRNLVAVRAAHFYNYRHTAYVFHFTILGPLCFVPIQVLRF